MSSKVDLGHFLGEGEMQGMGSGRGCSGQSGSVPRGIFGCRRILWAACENADSWVLAPGILTLPTWAEPQVMLMQAA